jgi:hypothetical protein
MDIFQTQKSPESRINTEVQHNKKILFAEKLSLSFEKNNPHHL